MKVGRVGLRIPIRIANQYPTTRKESRTPKLPHFSSSKIMSISSSLHPFPTKISQNPLFSRKPITNLPFFPSFPVKPSSFSSISIQNQPKSSSSPSLPPSLQSIEELPPNLQQIIKLFQTVQDPRAKYEQLLYYGRTLSPLQPQFKTKENKVEGCVSQVWVRAYLDPDEKKVFFEADSDSMLTKGLAALLVGGLSGCSALDIANVSPDFVGLLGLRQSLTPSRNNGFLNMLRLMQRKALLLYVEEADLNSQQDSKNSSSILNGGRGVEANSTWFLENSSLDANRFGDTDVNLSGLLKGLNSDSKLDSNGVSEINSSGFSENSSLDTNEFDDTDLSLSGLSKDLDSDSKSDSNSVSGSRGERIKERLERDLSPVELEVEDISYLHAGHVGVKGSNGETHFNVRIVSKDFEGKSMVKRHRLVYDLLEEELKSGLHALSIVAKTPDEI